MSPPDVSPGTPGQPVQSLPSDAFIVVPVRNTVLFPEIVFPITLGRPATIAARFITPPISAPANRGKLPTRSTPAAALRR